jgi:hypothetical protein
MISNRSHPTLLRSSRPLAGERRGKSGIILVEHSDFYSDADD